MDESQRDAKEVMDENDAAAFLHLSVSFLRSRRASGEEPRFVRLGRLVRYRREDLIAWLSANVVGPESGVEP